MRNRRWIFAFFGTCLLAGCTLASALTEIDNAMKFIQPLAPGIEGVISVVDPVAAPAVAVAAPIESAAWNALENYISTWAADSAAAQPGALNQVQAGISALQSSENQLIAAATPNSSDQQAIQDIADSLTGETQQLASVVAQVAANGGTTEALERLMKDELDGRGVPFAEAAFGHRSHASVSKTAKTYRADLVKSLGKSSNAKAAAARKALAEKIKALDLK